MSVSWAWVQKPKQNEEDCWDPARPLHPRSQEIPNLFFPTPFSTQPSGAVARVVRMQAKQGAGPVQKLEGTWVWEERCCCPGQAREGGREGGRGAARGLPGLQATGWGQPGAGARGLAAELGSRQEGGRATMPPWTC